MTAAHTYLLRRSAAQTDVSFDRLRCQEYHDAVFGFVDVLTVLKAAGRLKRACRRKALKHRMLIAFEHIAPHERP